MKGVSKVFQGGVVLSCVSLLVATAVWMSYHREECSNNLYLAIPDCGYTWTMQILFLAMSIMTILALFCQSVRVVSLVAIIFTMVEVVYAVIYLFSAVSDDFFKYQNNHEQERLYIVPLLSLTLSVRPPLSCLALVWGSELRNLPQARPCRWSETLKGRRID